MAPSHKRIACVAVGFVLAAAAIVYLLRSQPDSALPGKDNSSVTVKGDGNGEVVKTGKKKGRTGDSSSGRVRKRPKEPLFDEYEGFSPQERKIAEEMQQALDEEEFEPICAAAEKALKMSNTELRQKAVEALGWFGEKALVELTPFMADPDEDVSEAAVNAWVLAVSEIESPVEKMKVARLVLNTSASKDALFMVGGEYSNSASEYIDDAEDEETATQRRIEVLQPIVDMMENSRSANVAAAKEIYEDITGNEWRGFDEAELYLADPDNYELPEDREETLTPMPSETPVPETPTPETPTPETPTPETPTPETPTPEMPEPDEPDSETPGPIQP